MKIILDRTNDSNKERNDQLHNICNRLNYVISSLQPISCKYLESTGKHLNNLSKESIFQEWKDKAKSDDLRIPELPDSTYMSNISTWRDVCNKNRSFGKIYPQPISAASKKLRGFKLYGCTVDDTTIKIPLKDGSYLDIHTDEEDGILLDSNIKVLWIIEYNFLFAFCTEKEHIKFKNFPPILTESVNEFFNIQTTEHNDELVLFNKPEDVNEEINTNCLPFHEYQRLKRAGQYNKD